MYFRCFLFRLAVLILPGIIFMIDNKLLNNQSNVQQEKQKPPQYSQTQKVNSYPQKPSHISPKVQEDILQQSLKVIKNSSSQNDTGLQKFYKEKQQNDTKFTMKDGKNHRENKQEIGYIRNSKTNAVMSIYFIAAKQSNSGVFSHQRFFVVNFKTKQLMYYTKVPLLPLLNVQQISQKPKETIKLNSAQKITLSNPKKAIGQLQIKWIQSSQTKQWKLKLGNNQMLKQFVSFVQSIKVDKQVVLDNRQKQKYKFMKRLSPNNNKTGVAAVKKKDNAGVTKIGVSDLSNLLLKSMIAQEEQDEDPQINETKAFNKEKMPKKQTQNENQKIKIEKKQVVISLTSKDNLKKKPQSIIQIQQNIKNQQKEQAYEKIEQKGQAQLIVKVTEKTQANQTKIYQKQADSNKLNQIAELKPNKSLRIQEIIRNASIQYRQPQQNLQKDISSIQQVSPVTLTTATHIQQPRKSHLQAALQRRKQLEEENISSSQLKKKDKITLSKTSVKKVQKITDQRIIQSDRKKSILKTSRRDSLSNSRPKENIQYYQSVRPNIKARQNLLDERKYANSIKVSSQRSPKFLNQHNHSRREKSKSSSVSSSIEDYLLKQKQNQQNQNEWLLKWLTTINPLERGNIYKKIVDYCHNKVMGLTKKFNSWHLFHKEGEAYISKQGQINIAYSMLTSQMKSEQFLMNQASQTRKMKELSYLWNMTDGGKLLSKQYQVIIGAACLVEYKGLKVFCKLDVPSSKLSYKDVSFQIKYEHLLDQISSKCHSRVKSITIYEFILDKKTFLYIDSIVVQPSIDDKYLIFVNQNFVKNYVAGIIVLQQHLQKIHQHYKTALIPELIALLQEFIPLTTLDLQAELDKLGIDISLLPMAFQYCVQMDKTKQIRIIISQLCAQILASNVREDIHSFLLSKNAQKNIQEHIFALLMKNLRWDNDKICQTLWIQYKITASLLQIRDLIIDQYVIGSLFIKLGIKCSFKQQTDLLQVQKKKGIFWRQFQFNEQSISLIWTTIINNFDPLPFHQLKTYFSQLFLAKQNRLPQNKFVYDRRHLIQRLSIVSNEPYHQSWFFSLLKLSQRQLIKSRIGQQEPILSSLDWEQQNHPFYHLYHYTSAYYYTNKSFEQTLSALRKLINKQMYQQAHRLLRGQLIRAWIWGSHNSNLLMGIELLRSQLNQKMGNQYESLQSVLLVFQIGIKRFQQREIGAINLLYLCYRAAVLHTKYHKYKKALELYEICGKLFEKTIQENKDKKAIFQRYLPLYCQKARIYLKIGDYRNAQQSVKANFLKFFSWKDLLQHEETDVLNIVYRQEFQSYGILFRIYQLAGKLIEQVQLMQDCSVKFIQNYLELLLDKNIMTLIGNQQQFYFVEILKNTWVAVISNSSHAKIPSYQQYFNYYYTPLRSIKLEIIKQILIKLRKIRKGERPFQKNQAMQQMFEFLKRKIKKFHEDEQNEQTKKPKSILVIGVIDCLSLLSMTQNTLLQKARSSQMNELLMLEQIVSILGFEFTLGAIEGCINSFNTEF